LSATAPAFGKTVDWIATKRNQGEAHRGDPDIRRSLPIDKLRRLA
jgi:hypothetical protein